VKVSIFNRQKTLLVVKSEVEKIVTLVLSGERISCDEVGIYFVKKDEICSLHLEFFDDPSATDCITFPIDPPESNSAGSCYLGEIFICSDVALEYAAAHHLDPLDEQRLYLIHGLLHLVGYEDQSEGARKIMRKKEKSYMKLFRETLGKKKR
jgi:probable rRNA maturation factor